MGTLRVCYFGYIDFITNHGNILLSVLIMSHLIWKVFFFTNSFARNEQRVSVARERKSTDIRGNGNRLTSKSLRGEALVTKTSTAKCK